ncbi:Bacteriophage T4 gp9/10-like protein [compost metagenome]
MTKQLINLGAAVDDSTGDYLRQGGQKINANFEETFGQLGDGAALHPAGAWKTWSLSNGQAMTPDFGTQHNLNTLSGSLSITLPKGSPAEYGRVIKLRDVHASWGTNSVTIRPTSGDSLGGSTNPITFSADFTSIEFVYSSPATWRYVPNVKLDSLPKTEGSGVIVATYRVTPTENANGRFQNISPSGYNTSAVQVYRNGTLLTYDSVIANSDYGSYSVGGMIQLNGIDLYIPYVIDGDVITVISYTKDVAAAPVSYIRYDVQMLATDNPSAAVPGQSLKIKAGGAYTIQDLGRPSDEQFNPNACQIMVNGTLLIEAGTASLNPNGSEDYSLSVDNLGRWNKFTIVPDLEDGDNLTVIYFNNELGSVLEWDSVDGIKSRSSEIFLNTEWRFNRSNKIRYSDTSTPNAATAVAVPGTETNIRFENIVQLLESVYPIGTVYTNANNPANPALYMGFGQWQPYAQGRTVFGYTDLLDNQGNPDPLFGVNTGVQDENGNPLTLAGNLIGKRQVQLAPENIPELESSREYLREADNGEINLSGCIPLPGSGTQPLATFELATVKVNSPATPGQEPSDVEIIPPGITAYKWVRVA